MLGRLTGAQRLWLVFAVVFLASTIALIAVVWPRPEPGVVADLVAPECAVWRGMPVASIPDVYPEPGQPCYSLRSFLFHRRVSLATEADYASYLTREGAKTAAWLLAGWAVFAAGGYALAWSSARVVSALGKPGAGRAG